MTEETLTGDKNIPAGDERWSSYAMDEGDGTPSDVDDSCSHNLGDEWKNWRVDDPELESDETAEKGVKRRKRSI